MILSTKRFWFTNIKEALTPIKTTLMDPQGGMIETKRVLSETTKKEIQDAVSKQSTGKLAEIFRGIVRENPNLSFNKNAFVWNFPEAHKWYTMKNHTIPAVQIALGEYNESKPRADCSITIKLGHEANTDPINVFGYEVKHTLYANVDGRAPESKTVTGPGVTWRTHEFNVPLVAGEIAKLAEQILNYEPNGKA